MPTIALLGLGAMGTRVAQNLLQAGYPLVVYNRTVDRAQALEAQGATVAPTPRTAAAQADVVISMVTDDDASRSVWLDANTGALHSLKAGKIAIASSTLTIGWTQALAAQIQQTGAAFLDAPVVGSRPQAEAGKLIYLVGGAPETLVQVQPILLTSGSVQAIGDRGQGMAMKLAVNALFGIQVAALGEILGLLQRQGMTTRQAMDCLGNTPVLSPAAQGAGSLMVTNQQAPLFPTQLVEKDLRYALAAAQSVGTELPTTIATQQVFQQAIAQGYGAQNLTAVAQLYEQLDVSAAG
ncbi:MAG: NAD(P)-dependent oxidoreductase [Leptolyngbya sp. SIOISBB]|nr:NAD(P)-dependent oxidoreductase [Leptolyngbya sp. SIOISBB]